MNVFDVSEPGKLTKINSFATNTLFQGVALSSKSVVDLKVVCVP